MASEIWSPTAAYRPAHNIYIFSRTVIVEEKIIEGQGVFFDGIGNERSPASFIVAVGRVLDSIEGDVEFSHQRLNEISN